MEDERYDRAENRMNSGDGGLARHAVTCGQEVDWEKGKIIGKEKGWTQRKYLEEIESLGAIVMRFLYHLTDFGR